MSDAADPRPTQAFILGWPFAGIGGVNEVVRNLVREYKNSGPLAPLVIEASDQNSEETLPDGTPLLRLRFPTLYDRRRPARSLLKFCAAFPAIHLAASSGVQEISH